jgi:hypothetical protein
MLVTALVNSLASVYYVSVLMLLFFYMFGILTMMIFR